MSDSFPKQNDMFISEHFKAMEFDCPDDCQKTQIDHELIKLLEAMRTQLNCPIHINSGYRCPSYQERLAAAGYETAKGVSQHTLGSAADISTGIHTGLELETVARSVGFRAVGVGGKWIHVDIRDIGNHEGKDRRWEYVRS